MKTFIEFNEERSNLRVNYLRNSFIMNLVTSLFCVRGMINNSSLSEIFMYFVLFLITNYLLDKLIYCVSITNNKRTLRNFIKKAIHRAVSKEDPSVLNLLLDSVYKKHTCYLIGLEKDYQNILSLNEKTIKLITKIKENGFEEKGLHYDPLGELTQIPLAVRECNNIIRYNKV